MYSFFISVVSMAVVLGFMILIHELGHFIAAKGFGVRVNVFSIGFGKRLLGFRRGETDYRISALPLGGYVKMAGENPLELRTGAPDEFMSHPRWQRFVIAIAGPAMNILLAVGLLTVVYMLHYERPEFFDDPAVIGRVAPDTPVAKAGIEEGDRIVRVDGQNNPTWEDVLLKMMISPKQPLDLAVQRGNQIYEKQVQPDAKGADDFTTLGWEPQQTPVVTNLLPNMPAGKAGIKVNDRILAINDTPVHSVSAIIPYLQQNGTKPVDLTISRDSQQLHFNMTPVLQEEGAQKNYRLGFGIAGATRPDKLAFPKAFSLSLQENKRYSMLIVELVKKMVERKVSIKQMEGPIGIGRATGAAAQEPGWTPLLGLTAMISLNLGIFNLLPIPILDGGVILLLLIESVIRRDISVRIKERIYQTAFVFLILFAAVVIYNDVMKLLPGTS